MHARGFVTITSAKEVVDGSSSALKGFGMTLASGVPAIVLLSCALMLAVGSGPNEVDRVVKRVSVTA